MIEHVAVVNHPHDTFVTRDGGQAWPFLAAFVLRAFIPDVARDGDDNGKAALGSSRTFEALQALFFADVCPGQHP